MNRCYECNIYTPDSDLLTIKARVLPTVINFSPNKIILKNSKQCHFFFFALLLQLFTSRKIRRLYRDLLVTGGRHIVLGLFAEPFKLIQFLLKIILFYDILIFFRRLLLKWMLIQQNMWKLHNKVKIHVYILYPNCMVSLPVSPTLMN